VTGAALNLGLPNQDWMIFSNTAFQIRNVVPFPCINCFCLNSNNRRAGVNEADLLLSVLDSEGCELISYRPEKLEQGPLPGPAKEPPPPEKIQSIEELFIIGLHLDQYRHATGGPQSYWEEALRRDPGDARSNKALGLVRLRRGQFVEAERHFRRAVGRLTERNPEAP
jgi:hypothetical protein